MTQVQISPSEDKIIIAQRTRLEMFWLNSLTPTDQANWLTLWATKPPGDITGRTYSPFTPTTTTYAWSQIYGMYRFGNVAMLTPATTSTTTATLSPIRTTTTELAFQVSLNPLVPSQAQFIAFANQSHGPLNGNGLTRLRPLGWDTADSSTEYYDATAGYNYRFGALRIGTLELTMATIDENNTLQPSATVTSVEVT
jgi:hypothetical protein